MGKTRRKIPPQWDNVDWLNGYDPHRDHPSFGHRAPRYARGSDAVGPGGYGCPCCYDAPRKRKPRIRALKKRERREALRDQMED